MAAADVDDDIGLADARIAIQSMDRNSFWHLTF